MPITLEAFCATGRDVPDVRARDEVADGTQRPGRVYMDGRYNIERDGSGWLLTIANMGYFDSLIQPLEVKLYEWLLTECPALMSEDWRERAVPAPEHAAHAASFCRDQYRPGEEGYADPRLLQWWLVDDYPIARLKDAPDADWFRSEQQMWAEEGRPNRYDDMLDRPIKEPIVVYDTPAGGWLWDGNHRVGACAVRGVGTIPALVGMHWGAMTQVGVPAMDAAAETAVAVSDARSQEARHDRDIAALQVLLMDALTMLRDLKHDYPWRELATTYEDVMARAKALGLPVDEIEPL
jgi:hypothetical protein